MACLLHYFVSTSSGVDEHFRIIALLLDAQADDRMTRCNIILTLER